MANEAKVLPQYFAALTANLGGFILGSIIGWSSPTIQEIRNTLGISEQKAAWVGSVMPLGCATVMLPLPFLMNFCGRRTTMLLMAPINCASWIVLAFSNSLGMLCFGRFLNGLSGGTFCVAAPVYSAELAQPAIRGTLGVFFQLMITIGILMSYTLGMFLKIKELSLVLSMFPVILFVLLFFLPESPLHLMIKDKKDDVVNALHFFRGKDYNIDSELKELSDIAEKFKKDAQGSIMHKFNTHAAKMACFIIISLHVIQQLSGINAVIFYAHTIFKMTGSSISENICAIILGTVQVLVTIVSAVLVDRVGRKIMMTVSLIIMCICQVILGIYFTVTDYHPELVSSLAVLPLIAVNVYLIGFSIGAGPLPWAMLGEMFPNEIKNIASPIAAFLNWLLAFFVTKLFPLMIAELKPMGTYFIFAGICVIGALFSIIMLLETKGKTLDEIQHELSGDKN